MENRDWLILQELYHQKNITKAAESLFISQPALTKRIRQIEKEFGVQIVHRGRRGVHFTPQGEYLVKCADEMLLQLRKIKETVLNMDSSVGGTLRIGVSNYFARYQLPRLLRLFKNEYPGVEFKLITGWSKDIYKLIYNQDVHVAFVRGNYHWLDKKHLLFEEPICVASKEKIDLRDLPNLPRIDYQTDSLLQALMENWWTENYSQPPFIGMEVDKADTCREMVLSGLGYAILPRCVLAGREDLFTIDLTEKGGNPILRKTWMFNHEEALQVNVVKAFVRFIEKIDIQNPD